MPSSNFFWALLLSDIVLPPLDTVSSVLFFRCEKNFPLDMDQSPTEHIKLYSCDPATAGLWI
jgi:hypothetical protein